MPAVARRRRSRPPPTEEGVLYLREVKQVTIDRMRFLAAVRGETQGKTLDVVMEMWRWMRDQPELAKVLERFGLGGEPP